MLTHLYSSSQLLTPQHRQRARRMPIKFVTRQVTLACGYVMMEKKRRHIDSTHTKTHMMRGRSRLFALFETAHGKKPNGKTAAVPSTASQRTLEGTYSQCVSTNTHAAGELATRLQTAHHEGSQRHTHHDIKEKPCGPDAIVQIELASILASVHPPAGSVQVAVGGFRRPPPGQAPSERRDGRPGRDAAPQGSRPQSVPHQPTAAPMVQPGGIPRRQAAGPQSDRWQ